MVCAYLSSNPSKLYGWTEFVSFLASKFSYLKWLKGFPSSSLVHQPMVLQSGSTSTRLKSITGVMGDGHLLSSEEEVGTVGTEESLTEEFFGNSKRVGVRIQQTVAESAAHSNLDVGYVQLIDVEEEEGGVKSVVHAERDQLVELHTIATTGEWSHKVESSGGWNRKETRKKRRLGHFCSRFDDIAIVRQRVVLQDESVMKSGGMLVAVRGGSREISTLDGRLLEKPRVRVQIVSGRVDAHRFG